MNALPGKWDEQRSPSSDRGPVPKTLGVAVQLHRNPHPSWDSMSTIRWTNALRFRSL